MAGGRDACREERGQSSATPAQQNPQVGSSSPPSRASGHICPRPALPASLPPPCLLAPGPSSLPEPASERRARAGAVPPAGPVPPSSRSDDGLLHCLCGGIRHRGSWGQGALTGFSTCQGHKPRAPFGRLKGPGTSVTAPKMEPETQLLQAAKQIKTIFSSCM